MSAASTSAGWLACIAWAALFLSATGASLTANAAAPPNAAQIFALRKLPEPLVPTSAGEPSAVDNEALTAALAAFEARSAPDDFSALEQFIATHPQSPWRLAVQVNLGLLYYHHGWFSKTLPTFLEAWDLSKDATSLPVKALADRAAGEYAKMLARLGRYPELKAFVKSVEGRELTGQATELMAAGSGGAAFMETHPEKAFRCGPLALSRILAAQGSDRRMDPAIVEAESTMQGISLAQVAAISRQVGLNYQAARRTLGASLITPSVIHWKVGHYAALLKEENGRWFSEDPTFENATWHSLRALEAEGSGYFLVPAGPLPEGWTTISSEEAAQIFGKGMTSGNDPDACKECDKKQGGNQAGCCGGMARYAFHAMLGSLNIRDTPVGYDPPYGPSVLFQATYNQREAGQPSNFNYANLGPKWTCGWLSYITDDPAAPSVASQAVAGGGTLRFTGYTAGSQSFAPQYDYQSVLQRVSTAPLRYEQTYPDGSKEVFGLSDGSTTAPRKVFLTQQIDPAGNAITLQYDGQFRIISVTDALGQVTTLTYGLAGDPYKITKVTDPFGRHADLAYDASGRLIKITDVAGIESQFTYNGTGDFISALTTPYGTTRFTTTDYGRARRLTATDPQGDVEVLEFNESAGTTPSSDPVNLLPAGLPNGLAQRNTVMNARNTYYWSKKAWKERPNDYSAAHLIHWLHTVDFAKAGNVMESERPPLENRIWYNYPGQGSGNNGATGPGSMNHPSKVGRRLDDGTTQMVQFTYNALGLITSTTDAAGRVTTHTFEPNNQDLQSITQQTPGGPVTLATFTWNTQHRPLTVRDAAGQTTTYIYNSQGQPISETNAKGETTVYTYYAANAAGKQRKGRLQQVDGPLAGSADVVTFDYDAMGRRSSVTGPDGYHLAYEYDALDRPTRTTFPDATHEDTTYQVLDPVTFTDRMGRTTSFVYNSLRQCVSETDPQGRTRQYRWCKCGAMSQLIDPLNRVTRWKHDVAGRLTGKTHADGTTIAYSYQPLSGRLLSSTDERGQVRTLGYNTDSTISSITYTQSAVATPNVSFTYDPSFLRLSSMTDGTGTTSYTYYAISQGTLGAGRRASVNGPLPDDTITFTYDELGRDQTRAINGVGETFSYDALGRPVSVVNALGTFGYTYVGAAGRRDTVTYPNNMTCVYGYHPLNGDFRVQSITYSMPGNAPVGRHTYDYRADGRLSSWSIQDGASPPAAFTTGYDNAGRVTSFSSAGHTYGYVYDAADNRVTETVDGVTATAGFNAMNQLTSVDASAAPASMVYSWDAEDRLVAIDYTGTNLRTELAYDALNRCVRMVEKAGPTVTSDRRFVWSGWERCEERDALGTTVVRRFFAEGEQTSGQSFYYSRDHLGSVRQVTDGAQTIRARYDYDPYGRRTKLAGDVDATFGFTGHFAHAPSNLALAPLRAYDPQLGRWLSKDPIGEQGGMNLYGMTGNDPLNYRDPLGLDRYLISDHRFFHQGVAVDVWNEDCCEKIGKKYYHFGPATLPVDIRTDWPNPYVNIAVALSNAYWTANLTSNNCVLGIVIGVGQVDRGDATNKIEDTVTSNCEQDKILLQKLEDTVGKYRPYSALLGAHCRTFANDYLHEGLPGLHGQELRNFMADHGPKF